MGQHRTEYDEIKLNLIKKSLESKAEEVYVPKERRKGEDGILKFINLFSFTAWGFLLLLFAIITEARESISDIQESQVSVEFWNEEYLQIALIPTVICILVCTITIILNLMRNRRRSDSIKITLIIYEVIAFAMGIFLILKLY